MTDSTRAGDDLDLDMLRAWIGRSKVEVDMLTPSLVDRFTATVPGAGADDGIAPFGVQWCLAPDSVPMAELGEDGHPKKGGFLPPIPLPRRMWAAGALEFGGDLHIDEPVARTSTVEKVDAKSGKTGQLVFVELSHVHACRGADVIRERQTIVYRGASAPNLTASPPPFKPEVEEAVTPDEAMLFRYSALTFNAHRIHYDKPYAMDVEDYPGLVVHGPLTATMLMHLARRHAGGDFLTKFAFRGVGPAFCGEEMRLLMRKNGQEMQLAARSADGRTIMLADATFA